MQISCPSPINKSRPRICLSLNPNYLARARKAAGMEPRDETFDHEFPAPRYIKDLNSTRRETRRARRVYGKALNIGSRIDTLLECSLRQEQMAGRMKRLQAIENRCNNQNRDAGTTSF